MATSKEYRDYVLEKLEELGDITCRSMMGEYLLYYKGVLFGGIYDERLLIKKVEENARYHLREEIPYSGAKPMYLLDIDDSEIFSKIILDTYQDLKK